MSLEVQQMFGRIARRYDAANDLLSLGVHRFWRRAAVALSGARPGDRVLDCASGTGDLALAFERAVAPGGRVVGTDFCLGMLRLAPAKARAQGRTTGFCAADAQALPVRAAAFDLASIAFGIRNVDDPVRCLRELARCVRPGGRVVVLEFGQPEGAFGALYRSYATHVLPRLGGLLTGERPAYEYLPRTAGAFPAGPRFVALMDQAGCFSRSLAHPLWQGLAWVYVGEVAAAA
jgi:demethylmenaquinone methyltransferase/2-methoxy-6-polyprenyl-1,4-benzoquinol methylase